jgi:hypothetical protein
MQLIEKYDLVLLAETHVGYDSGIKHISQLWFWYCYLFWMENKIQCFKQKIKYSCTPNK